MTQSFGAWRATYTPGSWVVLAGPSSLVVMQPAAPRHSELVRSIWNQVVRAADADALVATLTSIGLSQMPNLGVFFWKGDRMWSLARGSVVVKDASSGQVVNHGEGLLTWREEGLDPSVVRVEMEDAAQGFDMPLMLGVALASAVTIDATGTGEVLLVEDEAEGPADAAVHPDVVPAPEASPSSPASPVPPTSPASPVAPQSPVTTSPTRQEEAPRLSVVPRPRHDEWAEGADDLPAWRSATYSPHEHEPAAVHLVASTGGSVPLDGPVLIGRAPNGGAHEPDAALLRVPSPSQDISRTHVRVAPSQWGYDVTDMNSTNGTTVRRAGEGPLRLEPGETVGVRVGDVVDLGDGVTLSIVQDH